MEALLSPKVQTVTLTPLQWSKMPDEGFVKPLNDEDFEVLAEVREVLARHNALDRFGINLLHRHFDIDENEFLLEETDHEERTQMIRTLDRSILENEKSESILQTQWAFNNSGDTNCVMRCFYNNGHGQIHRKEAV